MKGIFAIALIASCCRHSFAQEITLECKFVSTLITDRYESSYNCIVSKLQINPNASAISFTGTHGKGKTDASVEGFFITDCDLPIFNSALTAAMYSRFPNVKYVEVFKSNVQEITPGAFKVSENSAKIENVCFRFNNISSLANGAFDGLTGVKKLKLVNNRLTNVIEGAFRDLSSADYVELQYNSLKKLPKNVFRGLSKMTWLDISNNQLEVLDNGIFDGNENLREIVISYNGITAIGRSFLAGLYNFYKIDAITIGCANGYYKYREAAMRGLEKCFNNYDILYPRMVNQ